SLPEVRRLGFRYLEMEGLGAEHLGAVYQRRREVAARLADCGLHVHNFCVVDPKMVCVDPAVRRPALGNFPVGAEGPELLGAGALHVASYAPPVEYLGRSPYQLSAGYRFENTTSLRLPPGFSWPRVWEALVDSCRFCARVAADYGRTVIMEPRVGEVICSV